ncbi:T9SS type A sorting domain-containing protein, partial [bacterium]|nr:T9SS type A sorting domain-containing protein [bacterium]
TQSDTGGYIGETEYWPMDANHVVAVTHLSPIDNDPGRQMDLPDGVWNVITANITINFPGGGDGYVSATDSIFTIVDEPAREGFYTYASECDPIVPTLITRNMAFCAWLCHGSYVIPIECEDPGYYPDPSVLEVTVTNGCDPAETNCNDPECPRIEWSVFQWFKRVRPACQLYLVMTYCVADPGCVCIWRSDFFLPVEMLGFSAVSGQDNMVTLNWATASETNTETFIITRADSRDGLYRTVGSVRASGTTSDRHDYDFVDVGVENGRTYYYKLHTRDLNNNLNVYNIDGQAVVVDATPGAGNDVIRDYHLAQNYPNPFNSQTQFTFHIPAADHVTLKVFDLMGREVATVVNDDMSMGSHTISWDANHLPTGVYMYTMTSGNFSQTNKLLFLK